MDMDMLYMDLYSSGSADNWQLKISRRAMSCVLHYKVQIGIIQKVIHLAKKSVREVKIKYDYVVTTDIFSDI